ncbi:hypothetical protein BJ508DRAFT_14988 [Ascobolus immersus RN42]|uniref:Uncharacterized protein n=1 Tax=Ascobolus immersus RN42 TaxID=1160509 RepID=A0A3N4I1T9_ASCIM|nr:hypothetical protein BJ508DRAFT_14988 [Ascobolus immersus RN42]
MLFNPSRSCLDIIDLLRSIITELPFQTLETRLGTVKRHRITMAPLNTSVFGSSMALLRRRSTPNSTDPLRQASDGEPPEWQPGGKTSWSGGLPTGSSGIGIIAMVVSDAGLASTHPEWWNASPLGCILIGLQPRGGWQVLQRSVQWGEDSISHVFGVACSKPDLYCYFACSARNRIEVWKSERFTCTMRGRQKGQVWAALPNCKINRPSKLIEGSKGGQSFVCSLFAPKDWELAGDSSVADRMMEHYPIATQGRYQMLSIFMVAAASLKTSNGPITKEKVKEMLYEDFEVSDRVGVVFSRLRWALIVAHVLVIMFDISAFYDLFGRSLFGKASPYVLQMCSVLTWAAAAISLLMLGGNPHVAIVDDPAGIPGHVKDRIDRLRPDAEHTLATTAHQRRSFSLPSPTGEKEAIHVANSWPPSPPISKTDPHIQIAAVDDIDSDPESTEDPNVIPIRTIRPSCSRATSSTTPQPSTNPSDAIVKLRFGSLSGTNFREDNGEAHLPLSVVQAICSWDLDFKRSLSWYFYFAWSLALLGCSVALQVAAGKVSTVFSELMSVAVLIVTALCRGQGLSLGEEWLIPEWKMDKEANYAATMLGVLHARGP